MTIESIPGRAVVVLSREELSRYGTDCARMSLSDAGTRVMLGDVLSVLAHMGAVSVRRDTMPRDAAMRSAAKRSASPRVVIECACGPAGGCMLFFAIAPGAGRTVRFSGADAVLRAARAGALSDHTALTPDGDGYILALPDDIEWWRECLIREFTEEDSPGTGTA